MAVKTAACRADMHVCSTSGTTTSWKIYNRPTIPSWTASASRPTSANGWKTAHGSTSGVWRSFSAEASLSALNKNPNPAGLGFLLAVLLPLCITQSRRVLGHGQKARYVNHNGRNVIVPTCIVRQVYKTLCRLLCVFGAGKYLLHIGVLYHAVEAVGAEEQPVSRLKGTHKCIHFYWRRSAK